MKHSNFLFLTIFLHNFIELFCKYKDYKKYPPMTNTTTESTPKGSFFSNVNNYKPSFMSSEGELLYTIVLTRPGFTRADELINGIFLTDEELKTMLNSPPPRTDPRSGLDMFLGEWDIYTDQIALSFYTKMYEIGDLTKSLYFEQFKSLNGSLMEAVFVSQESFTSNAYLNFLIPYIYGYDYIKFGEAPQIFSFENLQEMAYNKENKEPVVPKLDFEYNTHLLGFKMYENCPNFLKWRFKANEDKKLLHYYQTEFEEILTNFTHRFNTKNNKHYFLPYRTDPNEPYTIASKVIDLSENQIRSNFSLGLHLLNGWYSHSGYFFNNNTISYLPSEETDYIKDFSKMHKFLIYDYVLHSNLHTYLEFSTFFEFLLDEFNNKISNSTSSRKILFFSVDEITISAIYKMLHYDSRKNRTDFDNSELPFIQYGDTIAYELWRKKSGDTTKYKIVMRENFKNETLFDLDMTDFNKLIKLILLNPNFSYEEKVDLCGI